LYQISNQITLGVSEKNAIENLKIIAMQLIQKEQVYRNELDKIKLEDCCQRAYGILKFARIITSNEMMSRLSDIQLGHSMRLINTEIRPIQLIVEGQPFMLMKKHGEISPQERDVLRAEMLRNSL